MRRQRIEGKNIGDYFLLFLPLLLDSIYYVRIYNILPREKVMLYLFVSVVELYHIFSMFKKDLTKTPRL